MTQSRTADDGQAASLSPEVTVIGRASGQGKLLRSARHDRYPLSHN